MLQPGTSRTFCPQRGWFGDAILSHLTGSQAYPADFIPSHKSPARGAAVLIARRATGQTSFVRKARIGTRRDRVGVQSWSFAADIMTEASGGFRENCRPGFQQPPTGFLANERSLRAVDHLVGETRTHANEDR